jgi:hypothetical protein
VNAFKSEFRRRNIDIVVVSFAAPEMLIPYLNFHEWPFPLLADPERKLYQAFDLKSLPWHKVFSPATLKLYLKLFRKGLHLQDYGKEDIYQSGGDFMLDRAGNVLFAHRSEDPADRSSVANLLKAFDVYLRPPPAEPTSRRLSY